MTTILKGITASIFRDTAEDYSNGGISSRVKKVIVLDCPGGAIFPATESEPAVRLVVQTFGGKRIVHAEPLLTDADIAANKGKIGPMFGGTYIASSDSRFSEATGMYGAIPLHDRWETAEECRTLST